MVVGFNQDKCKHCGKEFITGCVITHLCDECEKIHGTPSYPRNPPNPVPEIEKMIKETVFAPIKRDIPNPVMSESDLPEETKRLLQSMKTWNKDTEALGRIESGKHYDRDELAAFIGSLLRAAGAKCRIRIASTYHGKAPTLKYHHCFVEVYYQERDVWIRLDPHKAMPFYDLNVATDIEEVKKKKPE